MGNLWGISILEIKTNVEISVKAYSLSNLRRQIETEIE